MIGTSRSQSSLWGVRHLRLFPLKFEVGDGRLVVVTFVP